MIIFRADATPQAGLSHLRRSAYLASLLRGGGPVLVVCREEKAAAKFLAEKKIPYSLVRDPQALDVAGARALVFDIAAASAADSALLVRARGLGVNVLQLVTTIGGRLADDLAMLDIAEPENALLHHKFRHFHKVARKYRGKAARIFVNLGDALPYRDLRRVVDALHCLRFRLSIAPGMSLKKADKRNLRRLYPGIRFCGRSESPARAYFEADLALIPPCEQALEAACVGTPALYLPLDPGQEAGADSWAARGLGVKSPSLGDFSVQSVRAAAATLDRETREKMGTAGKALVDGLGVQRFLKILKESGIIA